MGRVRALACAILFLTRIPLPRLTLTPQHVRDSAAYFAWVGGLLALLLFGASLLFAPFGPRFAALLLVSLWVLLTGGLHLDGLADTVDGLSGGRGDRARALAIMRDSRIGAHGALALVLIVSLKWAALERTLELDRASWLIAPVIARFACTLFIVGMPYARAQGLASAYAGASAPRALAIGALALALACALLGFEGALVALLGFCATLPLIIAARRALGGLTGDVYGAAIELTELAVLLASALPRLR
jgi:adenosylcobinamide-GDP ribazoletransferase